MLDTSLFACCSALFFPLYLPTEPLPEKESDTDSKAEHVDEDQPVLEQEIPDKKPKKKIKKKKIEVDVEKEVEIKELSPESTAGSELSYEAPEEKKVEETITEDVIIKTRDSPKKQSQVEGV